MDGITRKQLDNLRSNNGDLRYEAFTYVLAATDQPVAWAYEVWDELVATLRHENNHQRSIAAQVLCNLAKSDPKQRMLKDFAALLAVTRDERFVTARHCLQALWKIGATGKPQQKMLLAGLAARFGDCVTEKNGTLIRYDIVQGLRKLYDVDHNEKIKELAMSLMETEGDLKYHKKYAGLWKVK